MQTLAIESSFFVSRILPSNSTFVEVTMNALAGRYPECSRKSRRLDANSTSDLCCRDIPIQAVVYVVERRFQEIFRKSSSLFGRARFFRVVFDEVCGQSFD